jgi:ABC-type sugar transport system ATPase subunit
VIERVTTTLGIAHLLERMPRELSGGQRQRVALARVLVRPADILLLDEPLSHLDAKLRATMRAELKSLGDVQRTTSLYVTHDYLEALALGDRIAVLREGTLVQVGTREDLWHRPTDTFVARAFGQPQINVIPGEIVSGTDGSIFRSQDGMIALPLPAPQLPAATSVDLGLRPRDLIFGEAPGKLPIRGRVYVVEPLGRQREVTVEIGENQVAIVTPHEGAALGDQVTISVAPERVLLFDGATGRRISRDELAPESRTTSAIHPEAVGYA